MAHYLRHVCCPRPRPCQPQALCSDAWPISVLLWLLLICPSDFQSVLGATPASDNFGFCGLLPCVQKVLTEFHSPNAHFLLVAFSLFERQSHRDKEWESGLPSSDSLSRHLKLPVSAPVRSQQPGNPSRSPIWVQGLSHLSRVLLLIHMH